MKTRIKTGATRCATAHFLAAPICVKTHRYELVRDSNPEDWRDNARKPGSSDYRGTVRHRLVESRRLHVLSQLLNGIAWPSLQSGLCEMRLLSELLRFLLSRRPKIPRHLLQLIDLF